MQAEKSLPKTVIAVVGDTGSGKSCLMNALLDHADILPTSGMRACTAVVVEISNNPLSSSYEADIEFLLEKVGLGIVLNVKDFISVGENGCSLRGLPCIICIYSCDETIYSTE